MQNYLILCHRWTGDADDPASLDWVVCANDAQEAVALWRQHMITHEWLAEDDFREAAENRYEEQLPRRVYRLPRIPAGPHVFDWSDLESFVLNSDGQWEIKHD